MGNCLNNPSSLKVFLLAVVLGEGGKEAKQQRVQALPHLLGHAEGEGACSCLACNGVLNPGGPPGLTELRLKKVGKDKLGI